jgi:hypothetical protein
MAQTRGRLQAVLDGYTKSLRHNKLALPEHQRHLVRWGRQFLHFAQQHGGYTSEQTPRSLPGSGRQPNRSGALPCPTCGRATAIPPEMPWLWPFRHGRWKRSGNTVEPAVGEHSVNPLRAMRSWERKATPSLKGSDSLA